MTVEFYINTIQAHIFAQINGEYKFLVLKRNEDEDIYPNIWQAVTGTMNDGEALWQTAVRETYEETGLLPVKIWTLPYVAVFFNSYRNQLNASAVYAVKIEFSEDVNLSPEHTDYKWLNFEDCQDILKLPSHVEGMNILKKYILENPENEMFLLKLNWQDFIKKLI